MTAEREREILELCEHPDKLQRELALWCLGKAKEEQDENS